MTASIHIERPSAMTVVSTLSLKFLHILLGSSLPKLFHEAYMCTVCGHVDIVTAYLNAPLTKPRIHGR